MKRILDVLVFAVFIFLGTFSAISNVNASVDSRSPVEKAEAALEDARAAFREAGKAAYEAEKALRDAQWNEGKAWGNTGKYGNSDHERTAEEQDAARKAHEAAKDLVRQRELEAAQKAKEREDALKKVAEASKDLHKAQQENPPAVLWDPSRDLFGGEKTVFSGPSAGDPETKDILSDPALRFHEEPVVVEKVSAAGSTETSSSSTTQQDNAQNPTPKC